MCSNGTHHFTTMKPYDPVEIGELNDAVNNLRSQLNDKDMQLNNAMQQANNLQRELADCRTQAANIETVVKTNRIPESIITFRQGKSVVDASQLPNVERVATYMKKHPEARVIIKGYASPEGNLAFNKKLANARAESVKTILVKDTRSVIPASLLKDRESVTCSRSRTGTASAFVPSKKVNNLQIRVENKF